MKNIQASNEPDSARPYRVSLPGFVSDEDLGLGTQ